MPCIPQVRLRAQAVCSAIRKSVALPEPSNFHLQAAASKHRLLQALGHEEQLRLTSPLSHGSRFQVQQV